MQVLRARRTYVVLAAMWAVAALTGLVLGLLDAPGGWLYAASIAITVVGTWQALIPPTRHPRASARRDPPPA